MGQKVNANGFRLSVNRNWDSRWFANQYEFSNLLNEDYRIRKYLSKKLRYAAVPKIFIERAGNRVRITIYTAKPGIVIGRKGQELEKLKSEIEILIDRNILLDIQEVKKPELVAQLVAENIAIQLERRIAFRRAMKRAVQGSMMSSAEGIRIKCAGRLGGSEIARSEDQRAGRVPLHTLRENINYGFSEAYTAYGIIGVKCWICVKK